MRWQLSMRASTSSANISRRRVAGSARGVRGRAGRRAWCEEMPSRRRRIWFLRRTQRLARVVSASSRKHMIPGGFGDEHDDDSEEAEKYDQSIFLNYYKMKRRWRRPTVLRAAGGPHQVPHSFEDEYDSDTSQAMFVCSEDESDISVSKTAIYAVDVI